MRKLLTAAELFCIACNSINNTRIEIINPRTDYWYVQTEDEASWLYIKEVGKGEPVIVIHGRPGAGQQFMLAIANGLEECNRFIFYDQHCAGWSYCPKDSITMQKSIAYIELIRKTLGVQKVYIFSHSFGTILAMNYLKAYPQSVKNIILLWAMDPITGDTDFFSVEELNLFEKKVNKLRNLNQDQKFRLKFQKSG